MTKNDKRNGEQKIEVKKKTIFSPTAITKQNHHVLTLNAHVHISHTHGREKSKKKKKIEIIIKQIPMDTLGWLVCECVCCFFYLF